MPHIALCYSSLDTFLVPLTKPKLFEMFFAQYCNPNLSSIQIEISLLE